jgi:branched-chain amino acid aminotransferase
MSDRFLYMNGHMVPYRDATVHVHSNAVKYGTSVFEGLRAYWNRADEELYVFRLDAHCRRLLQSLKLMRMEHTFDLETLRNSVVTTLKTNAFREDVHIRQTAYLAAEDGNVEATGPTGLAVDARPLRMSSKPALDVCVSTWVRTSDATMPPRIKSSANYQNSRLAMLEARGDGYDSALLLNGRGKVAEAPGAAFFMVRDGAPITPPVTADILESITRTTLIQLFRDCHGLSVLERDIDRTEIYIADEAFVCGTGWEVSPIGSIDRLPLGVPAPGALTLAIASTYFRAVRGELSDYRQWLTPVYRRS